MGVSIHLEISNKLGWNSKCVFVYATDDGNFMTYAVSGRRQANVNDDDDDNNDDDEAGVDSAMGSSSRRDNNARRWTGHRSRSCVPKCVRGLVQSLNQHVEI